MHKREPSLASNKNQRESQTYYRTGCRKARIDCVRWSGGGGVVEVEVEVEEGVSTCGVLTWLPGMSPRGS